MREKRLVFFRFHKGLVGCDVVPCCIMMMMVSIAELGSLFRSGWGKNKDLKKKKIKGNFAGTRCWAFGDCRRGCLFGMYVLPHRSGWEKGKLNSIANRRGCR